MRRYLEIIRWIAYAVFLWVLAELLYFHVTGNFVLYYTFYKESLPDPAAYLAFINKIYNIQPQVAATTFTNSIFPIAAGTTLVICGYDVLRIFESKKSIIWLIADIVLLIFFAVVHLF